MSVQAMKLVSVIGPVSEFDTITECCIINREFHPENPAPLMKEIGELRSFELLNPYSEFLRKFEILAEKTELGLRYKEFDKEDLSFDGVKAWLSGFEARFMSLTDGKAWLINRNDENRQLLLQLQHLADVDVHLEEFFKFNFAKFRFGRMPRVIFSSFYPHIKDRKDVYFFITSMEQEFVYGMYMTPRVFSENADALFKSLQFERIHLSGRIAGTSGEALEAITRDMERILEKIAENERETQALLERERDMFHICYSFIRYNNDRFDIRAYSLRTEETFHLLGWVPLEEYDGFVENLNKYKNMNFLTLEEKPEDIAEEYTPPTKLKNPKAFRFFEPFVSMYGLPSYNERDPTILLGLSYSLIFGIMFGDLGHGALLLLIGGLIWRFKRLWLGKVICCAGLSGMVWGLVYGSVFGNEEILPFGFHVLHNSQAMLTYSIYGGAGIITLAMIVNIVNGFRQGDMEKKLFGGGGLAGILLYWGIVLAVLPAVGFGKSVVDPLVILPCALIPLVFIFLREPLSGLCERRKDWKPRESPGSFIVLNFFEIFEMLLGFITNTLSFLRVGAYAISHASMMAVVYSLAKSGEGHNIVVLIIGNLIVAGIEGLLVAIQALRLEFYEIFGKFYNGSGKAYEPLKIDYTKHN